MTTISELQESMKIQYEHVHYHKKQVKVCYDNIHELMVKMYDVCEHQWVVDTSDMYDGTKYICYKCNLDKSFKKFTCS